MDFDIGSLLYIIITLVAVIIGLLGRKKKPSGEGSGAAGGGIMENLEQMLSMGQEEPVVVETPEDEYIVPEQSDPEPVVKSEPLSRSSSLLEQYEQYLGQTDSGAPRSEADVITEPLEVVHLEEYEGTDYFEVVKEFNAATAVVYSAIINRLDY